MLNENGQGLIAIYPDFLLEQHIPEDAGENQKKHRQNLQEAGKERA